MLEGRHFGLIDGSEVLYLPIIFGTQLRFAISLEQLLQIFLVGESFVLKHVDFLLNFEVARICYVPLSAP